MNNAMKINSDTDEYFLHPTGSTPAIRIDPESGVFELNGVSAPDDPLTFYGHLYTLLSYLEKGKPEEINVKIALRKIVDSKSYLFILIKKIISFSKSGRTVIITWYYEKNHNDILLTGQDISEQYNYPFQFKEVFKINYEMLRAS